MPVFSSRPRGYKTGVFLLFFAFVVFVVGFTTPYWVSAEYSVNINKVSNKVSYSNDEYEEYDENTGSKNDLDTASGELHQGLWMASRPLQRLGEVSVKDFTAFDVTGSAAWFHVVRLLECLCVIGLTAACVTALHNGFSRYTAGHYSRCLETMTAFSGLVGFTGCMVYLRKAKHEEDYQEQDVLSTSISVTLNDVTLAWAFHLAAIGSAVSVLAALVMAVCNKPLNYKPLDTPTRNPGGTDTFTTAVTHGQGHPGVGGPQPNGQPQPNEQPPPYSEP